MMRECVTHIMFAIVLFLGAIPTMAATLPAPVKPVADMTGFTKVVVRWHSMDGAVSYKVYRNDKAVATVNTTEYADSGLMPGISYSYKISAVNADGESPCSKVLNVQTLKKMSGQDASIVQMVVDRLNPGDITADNLLEFVRNSLKALNVINPDFVSIDPQLVKKMIDREMEIIRSPEPADDNPKETLDDIMKQYFKGNSFLDLYIQSKLTELAEQHWQAGKKEAALALYEKSLGYLSNVENVVFNTLVRIAYINFSHINLKSSRDEMLAALKQYGETMERYYKFFPNAKDENSANVRLLIAQRHFQCFPKFLQYDNYSQKFFDLALGMIKKAQEAGGGNLSAYRVERFNGWKLGKLKVGVLNPAGNPIAGTVTVLNSTLNEITGENCDERVLNLTISDATVPIYIGHDYDITATVPVLRGNPLRYTVRIGADDYSKKTVFNQGNAPVSKKLSPNSPEEVVFVIARPQAPYNLQSNIVDKEFTLSWDWANPSDDYQLKGFKIYRDGVEVGTTETPSLANIKIEAYDINYSYTVCACDANNQLSPRSPSVNIISSPPPDPLDPSLPLAAPQVAKLPVKLEPVKPPENSSSKLTTTSSSKLSKGKNKLKDSSKH